MSDVAASSGKAPSAGVTGLLSDRRLARRAAAGDQRAFAAIFNRYHQDIYRYCRAILRDSQEAQDALQNTMLKLLSSLPGEEREIRLKPWLYRIAHNESVEMLRGRRSAEELDPEAMDPAGAPDDSAEARGRLAELLSDLRELPERQRGALVMRELSGLSFEQIAEALETSPATARQTVYEARTSLQAMSEGREMACDAVRKALSDGDGRVLRGREIRAHLRSCEGCRDFKAGISERRRELAAIGPLPAVAAAGLLSSLLGGGGGGGGLAALLGGGAGAGAASAGLKSTAAVVAVSAVGVGAAAGGGGVDIGPLGGGNDDAAPPAKAVNGAPTDSQGNDSTSAKPASSAGAGTKQGDGPDAKDNGADRGARRNGNRDSGGTRNSNNSHAARAGDRAAHGQRTAAEARARKGRPQGLPPAASHGQETAASRGGGKPASRPAPPAAPPGPAKPAKPAPPAKQSPLPTAAAESDVPAPPALPDAAAGDRGKP